MKIFDYVNSSAAYRVRIACNLKGILPDRVPVDLRLNEQRMPDYLDVTPFGLVPALVETGGLTLTQSLAIIQYLDRRFPSPPLIPEDPKAEAMVWGMALAIACDIHPLNNLRVLKYLEDELKIDKSGRDRWYAHWIREGFFGLEPRVAAFGGPYCAGAELGLADICLVPQMFNARRFGVDVSDFPALVEVDARLRTLFAFAAAAP